MQYIVQFFLSLIGNTGKYCSVQVLAPSFVHLRALIFVDSRADFVCLLHASINSHRCGHKAADVCDTKPDQLYRSSQIALSCLRFQTRHNWSEQTLAAPWDRLHIQIFTALFLSYWTVKVFGVGHENLNCGSTTGMSNTANTKYEYWLQS